LVDWLEYNGFTVVTKPAKWQIEMVQAGSLAGG
jgi:hypothetical protein